MSFNAFPFTVRNHFLALAFNCTLNFMGAAEGVCWGKAESLIFLHAKSPSNILICQKNSLYLLEIPEEYCYEIYIKENFTPPPNNA